MHVPHLLFTEAADADEARQKVSHFIEMAADWSDWNEIGGRWEGLFDGENILCYKDNPELFKKEVADFQETMDNEFDRYLDEVGDMTVSELTHNYKHKSEKPDPNHLVWKAQLVIEMSKDTYESHSQLYDTVEYTSDTTAMFKRCDENPETQYAVIWDFHF
jgi:hypothetical protein